MRIVAARRRGYARTVAPQARSQFGHFSDRGLASAVGAEVPRRGELITVLAQQPLRKPQIAGQRLQHMLPGAYGIRVA